MHLFIYLFIYGITEIGVFDGAVPNLNSLLSATREDLHQWSFAGARGVSFLLALAPATS